MILDQKMRMFKFTILLLCWISYITAWASSDIGIEINGALVRGGCNEITDLTEAVAQWTRRLNESNAVPLNQISSKGGSCFVSLKTMLPDRFSDVLGRHTKSGTPNCFNTALNAQGLVHGIRMTGYHEITDWLSSNYCELNNRSPKPGDTIAVFSPAGLEHAIVYLTDQIGFHKWSNKTYSKFELVDYKSLHQEEYPYHVNVECQRVNEKGECRWYTQVFSCHPPKNSLYLQYDSEIRKSEEQVERIVKNQRSINKSTYQRLIRDLNAFNNSLQQIDFAEKTFLLNKYANIRSELVSIKNKLRNTGTMKEYKRELRRSKKRASWDLNP